MVDKRGYLQAIKLPISDYTNQTNDWENSVLGVQYYADNAAEPTTTSISAPMLSVPMNRLDDGDSICEVWLTQSNTANLARSGEYQQIKYRYKDDLLFGVIELSEALFESGGDKTPLQQATESAYNQIFSLLEQQSFPYLFRIRNYMADINGECFGLERYLQFNLGRQDAFLNHKRDVEGNVPAACALGFGAVDSDEASRQNSLMIAFLAGRVVPQSIENPRQISAYKYPEQYGPRSPTFARASLVKLGNDDILFLSGTASIVGHQTLHHDDVVAQTNETIENIKAVLGQANRQFNQPKFDLATLHYTVYVRHSKDLDVVRTTLKRLVGDAVNAVFLQADVCRQDLLVEIEATAGHSTAAFASDAKTLMNDHLN
jgi:chorismate lyase / 3-hydroxybenzoate synthase